MQTKNQLIIAFIKSNKTIVFGSFLFGFFSIVSTLLIPVFVGKYYQIAFHKHSTRGKLFNEVFGNIKGIETYFICFITLIFLKLIFDYGMKYCVGISGELFSKSIRESLFTKQLKVQYETHQKKETGLYLLRYSGDVTAIQHYLTRGIISFINDCLFLIFAVVILAIYNFKLTLILVASFPVIFYFILYFNQQLKKVNTKRRNNRSSNLSFVSSRLNALLTIKAFNRENIEAEKFAKKSTQLYENGKKYYRLYSLIYALLPFALYIMLVIILLVAYKTNHVVSHKRIHGSVIVTFIMLVISTIPVLKRVLGVNFIWQTGQISFTKLLKIYNAETETNETKNKIRIRKGSITFKDVTFSFDGEKEVMEKKSFEIPENSITLIKGPHQSGKSTLFKLILGLYTASDGEILIDNFNISEIDTFSLRRKITIVSDEFPLIGKNIFEAISYSRKEEKKAPTFEMLQKIGYVKEGEDESVLKNPIFENGKNISKSQRKVLQLARAFLTNKKIILLDESFEGLDDSLLAQILPIIKQLKKNHTIIIIDSKNYENSMYNITIDLN